MTPATALLVSNKHPPLDEAPGCYVMEH